MPVTCTIAGTTAVITIDNPPVNVIGHAVRTGLLTALDQAAGAERIILTGAGKTFVAGADAREFDAPPQPPHLPDILARIESLPCIAAINGAALGGGLEIALACRARIAAPLASLGLPEVTLGVVPGAGGTQRLPRLIGFAAAIAMISEGRTVTAAAALSLGLVDAIDPDPVTAARQLDAAALVRPALSTRPAPSFDAAAAQAASQTATKRMPGQIAPHRAIDLVTAATTLAFAEGMAQERATFLDLRSGPQAAALRHIFFAERAAMGQSRNLPGTARTVIQAIVVGGGTMGAGIAYALAGIGVQVTLVETDAAAADRARGNVAKLYADAVARGKSTQDAAATAQTARFSFAIGYANLPPAQIAIEAAFENLEVKRSIFAALAAALPDSTVLATNTSYLDINKIADSVPDPSRVLGLHFFSPAHVMKLVEIIAANAAPANAAPAHATPAHATSDDASPANATPANATSDDAIATAFRLAERLGKIPVRAGICDGFIGNRILTRYRQTCDILLIEGALPWQIDAAMRAFGMAMGPYETQDLGGLDIAHANRQRQGWKTRADFRYIPIADRLVEDFGRLGRKTGAGWYDHAGGKAAASALVEQVITEASATAGITRRSMTATEIAETAIAAMLAEARAILAEGIAQKPADIDLVMVHGYGFPRWRGGLMHHAETLDRQAPANHQTGATR